MVTACRQEFRPLPGTTRRRLSANDPARGPGTKTARVPKDPRNRNHRFLSGQQNGGTPACQGLKVNPTAVVNPLIIHRAVSRQCRIIKTYYLFTVSYICKIGSRTPPAMAKGPLRAGRCSPPVRPMAGAPPLASLLQQFARMWKTGRRLYFRILNRLQGTKP